MIVTVVSGDTLSGIAAQYGESLSQIEAANPSISDPNVISVGEQVVVLGGSSWTSSSSAPTVSSGNGGGAASGGASSSGGGFSIPGMPSSLANCIAQHESNGGVTSSNVFQIMPSSGLSGGGSLAQQEQTAGQLWATQGPSAWAADAGACPGA